jgi:flavin-dependent dehydrogenase
LSAAVCYEAVVVGAGPAGCATALALHRAGRRVCLVDDAQAAAASRPRVGEALPGAVRRLLPQLGIAGLEDLLTPADYRPCVANASAWGSDHWTYQDALCNPEGGGWHLNRAAFDASLRVRTLAAGVPVYPARLRYITTTTDGLDSGYHLRLDGVDEQPSLALHTPWLVDATGRAAFVSRRLQGGRQRLDNQLAAVAWVAAQPDDQDEATRIRAVPSGWWYTARLPTGQRVLCFHGLPATVAALVRDPATFLINFNGAALLPQPLAPVALPQVRAVEAGIARARQAASPGLLCVGDAALAFDPLAAQGLFFALYSGLQAGQTLARCLVTPAQQPAALFDYQTQLDQIFAANQRARTYFYASEARYAQQTYWRSRLASMVSQPQE